MDKKVRVRYAPSPTGHLHIGGARTALFNFLFAKHNNGDFIVRIEDTDIKRNIENGDKSQINNLEWLNIIADESPIRPNKKYAPYNQMNRLDIYEKYVNILLEKGHAYKCFCTSEELEKEKEAQEKRGIKSFRYSKKCLTKQDQNKPYSIRIKIPENKTYSWDDLVRGKVSIESEDIGDYVIVKTNKIPTYNFAVVVDDIEMEISHVLRGEEHISNTPKQLAIYEALGKESPIFGHMTLITNEEGKKLSKRDESIMQFIEQYKNKGYLPEAIFNFLSLLGWSPEGEEEIFSTEELIKIFDVKRLSKSPSMFDKNKLTWINNRYIKSMSDEDYLKLVLPFMEKAYGQQEENNKIAMLYKNQLSYGEEIIELSKIFLETDFSITEESKEFLKENPSQDILDNLIIQIEESKQLDIEEISTIIMNIKETTNKKGKQLFMPIRIFFTGQMHGPDLKETIKILGKEKLLLKLKSR